MERSFDVSIEIGLEYEVGSPPDTDLDPYLVAQPDLTSYEESWKTREGSSEGVITSETTALYPPFTDVLRRQIFCLFNFATLGTTTIEWNAETFPVGRIFLTTDPGWDAAGVVIASPGEGSWFACEGELEEEFRQVKRGTNNPVSL